MHQWDQSNLWKDGWENSQAKDFALNELKRKLYRAVANVNILKELGSMSPSHARLLLENLNLWKDRQKLYPSSPETKTNT